MSRRLFWDAFTGSIWVKVVALVLVTALVVVQCGREGGTARRLGALNYDSLPKDEPRPTRPAEQLHAAVGELRTLLAVQGKRDLSGRQADKARSARDRIGKELKALDRQFDADRSKLEDLGADAALTRLDEITERATKLERSLDAALARLPADGTHAEAAAGEVTNVLAQLSPEKPQQPLSSDLAFGINNAERRPAGLSAGITPAYGAPTAGETASDLPRTAEQEDLAEVPETKVTPAVEDLAQRLHGDPVEIYEWVRNEIRYEPYHGIRKGADLTYMERSGSAADQAALLIALLRASGIHARFVQGVAQLPAATAANWVGIDTRGGERLEAAPEILAAGGIPTTEIRANGELVRVKFEHVWAEAFVPNDAYRGAEEGRGGKTWLPLDPSIKRNDFSARQEGLREAMRPSTTRFLEDLTDDSQFIGDDAVIAPPQEQFRERTMDFLEEQQAALRGEGLEDGDQVAEAIGGQEIVPVKSTYLPATTPFKQVAVAGERRALPDSLSASVELEVSGSDPLSMPSRDPEAPGNAGFSFRAKTLDLAHKRVTVSYVPATPEDAEIIDAYHGLLNAPTYVAALIPVLRVDGRVVARGHQAVSTGFTQKFRVVYRMPGFAADAVENPLEVGSLSAVSLDVGRKSLGHIKHRAAAMQTEGTTTENILTDARLGEMLSILGDVYFARNDRHNALLADMARVDARRSLSGAIVATSLRTTFVAGFPVSTALSGPTFDVDQDVQSVTSLTRSDDASEAYMRASGLNTSLSEGQVLEHFFDSPAASTTKVLGVAAQHGMPIYRIDSSNVDRVAPELTISPAALAEIRTAVSEGATVVVPKSNVTIAGWTGAGYIVTKGTSSDYRIHGGASGGALIPFPVFGTNQATWILFFATKFGSLPDRIGACIGLLLDIAAIWTIGTGFLSVAGGFAATVEVLLLSGAVLTPFGVSLVVVFTAMLLLLMVLFALNDGHACFHGPDDDDYYIGSPNG
jgi:transglutaminase-like putative cysteine protease